MNIIDIARECGASTYRQFGADGQSIEFQEAALTAFADRIRADERKKCAAELKAMHKAQLGSATEHNYFLCAANDISRGATQIGEKGR